MAEQYEKVGFTKRGYYLPNNLLVELEKLVFPYKQYSADIAGALLIWIGLDSDTREQAKKATENVDIRKAANKIKQLLIEKVTDAEVERLLSELSPEGRILLLESAKQAVQELSHKK